MTDGGRPGKAKRKNQKKKSALQQVSGNRQMHRTRLATESNCLGAYVPVISEYFVGPSFQAQIVLPLRQYSRSFVTSRLMSMRKEADRVYQKYAYLFQACD